MDKERAEAKRLTRAIFGLDDQMIVVVLFLRDKDLDRTRDLIMEILFQS